MLKKALLLMVVACGCGSDAPADVSGAYTLSLTVQQNDCAILGGPVGESSSGVGMVVTQNGSDVSAQLQGAAALLMGLVTGNATFTGKVAGRSLDLAIEGIVPGADGTCAFTRNARLQAELAGDVLTGTVTYTFATNKTADCGARDTCRDVQVFNGTRPPRL